MIILDATNDRQKVEWVKEAGKKLHDHKCNDIKIFDIGDKSGWTDFFVVATVSSSGHMRGVLKHLYAFLDETGCEAKVRQKKIQQDNWIFIDCAFAVFHIMNQEARDFYQLENLWFKSTMLYSS